MPTPLAPVTISPGAPQVVTIGSAGTVGAVVIGNESPYAVMASGGSGGIWVLAQMADRLNCDTLAFNGNITLTVQNYLSNASQAPSFQVYLTTYAPGEPIPGTYPCALSRMFNVGNTIVSNSPANVFEQDLLTPFVYTGYVATKDGVTTNQLDVAAGIAFLRQSSDNSLLRIANNATSFLTTTPSTTYFLDLNPDGSWSFATAHSGVANHLTIAQATTDASGNIATVTDMRVLNTQLLGAMAPDDAAVIQMQTLGLLANSLGAGIDVEIGYFSPGHALFFNLPQIGASAIGTYFHTWDGTQGQVPLSIGGPFAGAHTVINQTGGFNTINDQATAGSVGVPVIVAQALLTHVTSPATQILLSYAPNSSGLYRVSLYAYVGNATSPATITADVNWEDPHDTSHTQTAYFTAQTAGNGAVTPLTLKGASVVTTANGANNIGCFPITVYALSGGAQPIDIRWTDATATPNDFVSVLIERLA